MTAFLGTEATASGLITPGELRYGYRRIYPNVYVPRDEPASLAAQTTGAWLWARRGGVITGAAASALHGARWVDDDVAIELIYDCRRPPAGIISRNDRISGDEIVEIDGMAVVTPARAALDLGRYLPRRHAVARIDALAHATGLTADQILPLANRYRGSRGVRRARMAVQLMDGGAQSPKESWLRQLLIDAGFPRPRTQIPVFNNRGFAFAYLDMGWEDMQIAVEYDGDHHRKDRRQYAWDLKRARLITARGWLLITMIAEDRHFEIIEWVR